jgi:pilus assembly protein Flp/PilA
VSRANEIARRDRWRGTPPHEEALEMAIQMLATLFASIGRWGREDEEGQTMAEYGLLLAAIAVVVAVAAFTLGEGVRDLFGDVTASLAGTGGDAGDGG